MEGGSVSPRDSEQAHYGFDLKEYPGLAEAADAWAERCKSRRQRWSAALRSKE
jgi:hypothetical protein